MIDFRYHLVSIVAVFLALATGLLLGSTTAAQEASKKIVDQNVQVIQRNNDELRAQVKAQGDQLAGEERFAEAIGPQILADRLKDESVLFVLAPGAEEAMRTGLDAAVKEAGGTVTGWVSLTDKFLSDDQVQAVDQLAEVHKPADLTYPEGADAYTKAGTLLATMLVTKDADQAGHEEVGSGSVLQGFRDQGLLTTGGKPGARATLAVVVAPASPFEGDGAEEDDKALVALTAAFDRGTRGTVAAGDASSAGAGGLLSALRSSDAASSVSSVDAANTASGQIVTVLALNVEMSGRSGHYGTGSDVSGYLPEPLPTVPTTSGEKP
ncbi:copper transporter [Actinocorallia libanotica]|uniref:Copper transporter n=1 Tax=Actinocorallia libanotica TaxID=46162 RepID=A0ABN1PYJ7_9ACTN